MARRIAIIGGGPAGLAAAFELALRNGGGDVITVYQSGWRLGGKCSTARDPATGRIHEHGLHVFGGFYHNSWRQLHLLYRHWQDVGTMPLPLESAFIPVDGCILTEPDGRIIPVALPRSERSRDYEQGEIETTALIGALLEIVFAQFSKRLGDLPRPLRAMLRPLRGNRVVLLREAMRLIRTAIPEENPLPRPVRRAAAHTLAAMLRPLRDALQLHVKLGAGTTAAREQAQLGAFAAVVAIGLLEDDLLPDRFDRVNHLEASDWLRRHGADEALVASAFVRAAYDYAFAYGDGVTAPPRRAIAAGTAVHGYMNLALGYTGALFYHFSGGTAELLAAPYYEVLQSMGVRFAFFHRIDALELDPGGRGVARIRGLRQAAPLAGPLGYAPLYAQHGRLCWPAEPDFAQIADGEALRTWLADEGVTLETDGTAVDPPGALPFALERGSEDADDRFTDVVLAVPPAVLARIAAPLAARDASWARALSSARSCPTIAVELRGRDPLGTSPTPGALLTAHIQPFGTWADMSFLDEGRGADAHLSYLCGVWPNGAPATGEGWTDYVARELAAAEALTHRWLADHLEATLRAGLGRTHEAIPVIDDVQVRLNLGASESYVQSPAGSIGQRLPAGATCFDNVFVAGDWTRNGVDAGCYEAAVVSALACADALAARVRA